VLFRSQLDGTGGNNHAIEHYDKTKYPLAVKLGTINAKGADVYSYDEDDMVEDANLSIHLAHFGINMNKMEKSDKTMAELEIDLNQKVGEWDRIQESGSKLVPAYGPGFTGMQNLGNSCYMNSVMQVLFSIPEFAEKYSSDTNRNEYLRRAAIDPSNDFSFQMSKLGHGLLSGKYSVEPEKTEQKAIPAPKGIKPTSFKSLIGKGHPEFMTKRQQDAHEFLMHLISLMERNARNDLVQTQQNPIESLKFKLEERIECAQSSHVKYTSRDEYCLSVPISKELALNKPQLEEYDARKTAAALAGKKLEPGDIVRPEIALTDCLKAFAQIEHIEDFYSSSTRTKGVAYKSTRLTSFPDFLVIQAKKFELAPDWTPIKLDVSLQVPDLLDLTEFRGTGKKADEQELTDEQPEAPEVNLNENILSQLIEMGFSLEGSKRAAYNTREQNDYEAAVNWAVAHMEDSDFNNPFELPSKRAKTQPGMGKTYSAEDIESLTSLGFNRQQAVKALEATNNDVVRAADWIFSHMDELMELDEPVAATSAATTAKTCRDGNGVYKLVAFISHMGTNANVGHYVAHILKEGNWYIFNDENVAKSEHPPKDLAYLYLYQRV